MSFWLPPRVSIFETAFRKEGDCNACGNDTSAGEARWSTLCVGRDESDFDKLGAYSPQGSVCGGEGAYSVGT